MSESEYNSWCIYPLVRVPIWTVRKIDDVNHIAVAQCVIFFSLYVSIFFPPNLPPICQTKRLYRGKDEHDNIIYEYTMGIYNINIKYIKNRSRP